jgi:hypothetical protein
LAGASETPADAGTDRPAERPDAADDARAADASSPTNTSRAVAPVAEPPARPSAATTLTSPDRAAGEVTAKVVSLEQYGPQMWLIALEGGQQWRQTIGKPYRLHVGDEVRVYPTRWGDAYRLSAERIGGYIQVVRAD